jgi:hypothetical protein
MMLMIIVSILLFCLVSLCLCCLSLCMISAVSWLDSGCLVECFSGSTLPLPPRTHFGILRLSNALEFFLPPLRQPSLHISKKDGRGAGSNTTSMEVPNKLLSFNLSPFLSLSLSLPCRFTNKTHWNSSSFSEIESDKLIFGGRAFYRATVLRNHPLFDGTPLHRAWSRLYHGCYSHRCGGAGTKEMGDMSVIQCAESMVFWL